MTRSVARLTPQYGADRTLRNGRWWPSFGAALPPVARARPWLVASSLAVAIMVSGCTTTGVPAKAKIATTTSTVAAGVSAVLSRLLVGSPTVIPGSGTSYDYAPCPNPRFAPECDLAIASAATPTDTPLGSEALFEYASPAAAAAAQQHQSSFERTGGWPCGVATQCPVTPLDAGNVGVPLVAVSFTLGARGNLSEVNCLATAWKGRYLLNFAWISASTVSRGRVTTPAAVRSYLLAALNNVPG